MDLRLGIVSDAPSREAWIRLYTLKLHNKFDHVVTFNDTGFTWLDITREKIHMRFHDSSGKIIYEYIKKK